MVVRSRLSEAILVLAFGACLGQLIGKIEMPTEIRANRFDQTDSVLCSADRADRNLYLRHTFHLPSSVDSAWIHLVGRDVIEFYVNGSLIKSRKSELIATVITCDLEPHLKKGKNVIAIVCRQKMLQNVPQISVVGECRVGEGVFKINVDSEWRAHNRIDRLGDYWTSLDFEDQSWELANRSQQRFRGSLEMPLSVATSSPRGEWIGAKSLNQHALVYQRSCLTPEPVVQGWLRVQSTAAWRLALNGVVVTSEENTLGTNSRVVPNVMRICDISAWLDGAENRVRFLLREAKGQPQLRVDLELIGRSGKTYRFRSDPAWKWRSLTGSSWLEIADDSDDWQSCDVLALDDKNLGSGPKRSVVSLVVPREIEWQKKLSRLALMLGVSLATWVVIELLGLFCGGLWRRQEPGSLRPAILALLLPTALLATAMLVTYDVRFPDYWLYRFETILMVLGLVAFQWICLLWLNYPLAAIFRDRKKSTASLWDSRLVIPLLMLLIVGIGIRLRTEQITVRPLSPDEVTMYRVTMSIWEYGYPTLIIHEDLPPVQGSTSELVPYGHWLVSIFVDNDRLVVRVMPTIFGIATIFLLFRVGQVMYNPWVGVLAAGVYALSPYCAALANSARYYSQLQFMTLLVVYFFYRTVRPAGPISVKYFWATVVTFCLMFVTWEGSAMIGFGLAVAGLVIRRDRIGSYIFQPHIWVGAVVIVSLVLVQSSHRTLVQTARPLYGSGASDVSATPMWQYPAFHPEYYLWATCWNNDALLPTTSLLLAFWLTLRHPFRHQTRFLLFAFLSTCLIQALILPVTASRYADHFAPLWQLFGAAGLWAFWREMTQWRPIGLQALSANYRRAIAACVLLPVVVLGSGLGTNLSELTSCQLRRGQSRSAIKNPGHDRTTGYVMEHARPEDIVIVNAPHAIDHYLDRPSDYWLQSHLHLQCVITDADSVPRHRYKGTPMLPDVDHLREVFSRNQRIWFIAEPGFNNRTNEDAVVQFMRDNMDVVFEGYGSLVMFRDQHRNSTLQREGEKTLRRGIVFLP